MFSKLTAFLQQAAEITSQIVLGPGVSRADEFQGHWKGITDMITSNQKGAQYENRLVTFNNTFPWATTHIPSIFFGLTDL